MSRTHDQRKVAMVAILDQIKAMAREHADEYHGGESCLGEAAGIAALVTWTLGLRGEDMGHMSLFAACLFECERIEEEARRKDRKRKDRDE